MPAIVAGPGVIVCADPVKVGRQIRILQKRGSPTAAKVRGGQVPTGPVWFAQIIAVIERFHRAKDEKMVMIVGIGGGIAWISKLHLQGRIEGCRGMEPNENETEK